MEQFDQLVCWVDRLAWLAALERRLRTSAMLLGYADAVHARIGPHRDAYDSHLVDQVERTVRVQMGDAEFERLKAEGAAFDGSNLAALAFGTEDVR